MDVEAEMVYADILRTLQSSILNVSILYSPLPVALDQSKVTQSWPRNIT